ncbi:MAG: gamma-glutamyltransferase [Deltaproteobacteria bacterium]|nr:gamma-glutamyltransferase [Deltaproteobacteria bacterium]
MRPREHDRNTRNERSPIQRAPTERRDDPAAFSPAEDCRVSQAQGIENTKKGAVAAGHEATAAAAAEILRDGGNAFDALIAGLCASCIAEPMLSSLGGGGFLVARSKDGVLTVYDFFAQTPLEPKAEDLDFYPISGDFGSKTQEFHIGLGSIACPGVVKGMFAIHQDLCQVPMSRLVEPAIRLAREGLPINSFQAFIQRVLTPIVTSTEGSRRLYGSPQVGQREPRLLGEGDIFRAPEMADLFEQLSREGDHAFYRGDLARQLVRDCRRFGGQLSEADLENYRVHRRRPLECHFAGAQLATNPLPSAGGTLISFGLQLLEDRGARPPSLGTGEHLAGLARAMELTNRARKSSVQENPEEDQALLQLLEPKAIAQYREFMSLHPASDRGTTQISVADGEGNLASLTVSNGEGSGYVAPGTGVMLNNMLGEEDLNPKGFLAWPANRRLSSMMAPTLVHRPDGRLLALGSGGSNRLRTAILQVLLNTLRYDLSLEEAVAAPRLHFERDSLDLEPGYSKKGLDDLRRHYPQATEWEEKNLFFGGVHLVSFDPRDGSFRGVADGRRGGVARWASNES